MTTPPNRSSPRNHAEMCSGAPHPACHNEDYQYIKQLMEKHTCTHDNCTDPYCEYPSNKVVKTLTVATENLADAFTENTDILKSRNNMNKDNIEREVDELLESAYSFKEQYNYLEKDFCKKARQSLTRTAKEAEERGWKNGFQDGLESVNRDSGDVLKKLNDVKLIVETMRSWVITSNEK